jgi:hypothetical protein
LVSGAYLGPVTNFSFSLKFPSDSCVFYFVAASLTKGQSVIYCTIASGLCQSSHSWVEVPQNSRPYITVSFETPQSRGPGSRISPRNRVAQLYPRALGSPFCPLLRLAGQRWRYSNPPPYGVEAVYFLLHNIYKFSSYLTRNTIHLRSESRNSNH